MGNKKDNKKRGCLKINLRWLLLFHFRLKSFVFFSKRGVYKLVFEDFIHSNQCCPKRFSIKTKKGSKAKVE